MNLNFAFNDARTFSAHVVNELRIGYNRMYMRQIPFEPLKATVLGMTPPVAGYDGIPAISVTGFFNIGPAIDAASHQGVYSHGITCCAARTMGKAAASHTAQPAAPQIKACPSTIRITNHRDAPKALSVANSSRFSMVVA